MVIDSDRFAPGRGGKGTGLEEGKGERREVLSANGKFAQHEYLRPAHSVSWAKNARSLKTEKGIVSGRWTRLLLFQILLEPGGSRRGTGRGGPEEHIREDQHG